MGIEKALQVVKHQGDLPVPLHIRNAPTRLMKNLDDGKNYQYDHCSDLKCSGQYFLPDEIKNTTLYEPGKNLREEEIKKFLKDRWKDKYNY